MSRIPPLDTDSRPNTNTSSDFDAFGTPLTSAPFLPASPLGHGEPMAMPSALSLAASTPRASASEYARFSNYGNEAPTPNNNSAPLLPHEEDRAAYGEQYSDTGGYNKEAAGAAAAYGAGARGKKPLYKRPWFWIAGAVAIVVIALAIALPLVFVNRNKNSSGSTSSGASTTTGGGDNSTTTPGDSGNGKPTAALATWGGDGSTVTKEDGTTFIYKNSFGGFWVSDPANPFNNSARPNSWTPALGSKWTWGKDRIHGVNLGGLFVLEPFISPALFQAYPGAQDEWDLSAAVTAGGGNLTDFLSKHYDTFITEEDIAQIAGAGLNWIRLPIPFWAIEAWSNVGTDATGATVAEPFLANVCWQYILRVLSWCRKYGLRVNLDMHTAPGSQNGYNHSGKLGTVNFMRGVMGVANAQRTLDYLRTITEFITQAEYVDLVPMFSILNEALLDQIGKSEVTSFYLEAHNMIRGITGLGEGHGPFIFIHDGFGGVTNWGGFLEGSDRIGLDTHPYFAFDGQPNTDAIDVPAEGASDPTMMGGPWPKQACSAWAPGMNTTRNNFGVVVAGEFSNAINDCGTYVRGVANGPSYGGDCSTFLDASTWSDNMKNGFMNFQLASMDALGDWFFWTWKIGNDSTTNSVRAPLWSYQLGLEGGWIPPDPRKALGTCAKLGVSGTQFSGTFESWQTGGAGAGTIAPSQTVQFGTFPPTSINGVPAGQVPFIYSYTTSRAPLTLPAPTFAPTASVTAQVGNGWANAQDTAQFVTAVAGCAYPDAWNAGDATVPASACGATAGVGGAVAVPVTSSTPAQTSAAVPPVASSASSSATSTGVAAVTARAR